MKSKIKYLLLPNGERLVSWHTLDYKQIKLDGEMYMIDGGQGAHIRYMDGDHLKAHLVEEPLHDALPWVRKEFEWTSQYDKDMNVLKTPVKRKLMDLELDHIERILEQGRGDEHTRLIFKLELKYRKEHEPKTISNV